MLVAQQDPCACSAVRLVPGQRPRGAWARTRFACDTCCPPCFSCPHTIQFTQVRYALRGARAALRHAAASSARSNWFRCGVWQVWHHLCALQLILEYTDMLQQQVISRRSCAGSPAAGWRSVADKRRHWLQPTTRARAAAAPATDEAPVKINLPYAQHKWLWRGKHVINYAVSCGAHTPRWAIGAQHMHTTQTKPNVLHTHADCGLWSASCTGARLWLVVSPLPQDDC